MSRLSKCLVVSAFALWVASVGAQPTYPSKPIRLIVPTPAGGPSDTAARAMAKGMSAGLGQEVFVENRPGANAGIGAGAVLTAPPDGYTLLFALASNAGLPHLSKASPYKSLTEFSPIAAIGGNTQCLVVPASVPAKTLQEFAGYAKASAKPLMRGSNNVSEDMVATEVTRALGFILDRVPYKGGTPDAAGSARRAYPGRCIAGGRQPTACAGGAAGDTGVQHGGAHSCACDDTDFGRVRCSRCAADHGSLRPRSSADAGGDH